MQFRRWLSSAPVGAASCSSWTNGESGDAGVVADTIDIGRLMVVVIKSKGRVKVREVTTDDDGFDAGVVVAESGTMAEAALIRLATVVVDGSVMAVVDGFVMAVVDGFTVVDGFVAVVDGFVAVVDGFVDVVVVGAG